MLAKAGAFVEKDIFLAFPNAKTASEGRNYTKFFKLTSQMDFENIGVRRPIAGEPFRYLTCADCDMGPVGITYDEDKNKVFYIAHDRVLYA
jgi:hypothetical protein